MGLVLSNGTLFSKHLVQ